MWQTVKARGRATQSAVKVLIHTERPAEELEPREKLGEAVSLMFGEVSCCSRNEEVQSEAELPPEPLTTRRRSLGHVPCGFSLET